MQFKATRVVVDGRPRYKASRVVRRWTAPPIAQETPGPATAAAPPPEERAHHLDTRDSTLFGPVLAQGGRSAGRGFKGPRDASRAHVRGGTGTHTENWDGRIRALRTYFDIPAEAARTIAGLDSYENYVQFHREILDLPGMDKDKINVEVKDHMLVVSGERTADQEQEGDQFYKRGRSFRSFSRSVMLPEDADDGNLNVKYEKGVLEVTIPKEKSQKATSSPSQKHPIY